MPISIIRVERGVDGQVHETPLAVRAVPGTTKPSVTVRAVEYLAQHGEASAQDIAAAIEEPRATADIALRRVSEKGFVVKSGTRYRLAPGVEVRKG